MKNTQLYPFERNKYFYGKLLSVEDFNSEQKYINDKRRLTNRLVHGMGVVCGLNVVRIDEQTISVESGMAFDQTGREIVVDSPVTKKLPMINGYDSAVGNGSNAYTYLCLEYSENENGYAHNIVSEADKSDSDKIREGYNLYLTSSEPEDNINQINELFEQSVTVFWDGNIRIKHITPRYVSSNSKFEFRVEIESYTKQYASFSYDSQLICLNYGSDGSAILRVNFDEMLFEKSSKYTLTYVLEANNVIGTEGTINIDPATFSLSYDKTPAEGAINGKSVVSIINGSVDEYVINENYRYGMDTVLRRTIGQRLYLARINLINVGGLAIIENIENVPFNQYVASNLLLNAMNRLGTRTRQRSNSASTLIADTRSNCGAEGGIQIASGVCRINLDSGSLKNKVFYSDEIIHGLGLGSVTIVLGVPTSDNGTVYGNPEIFKSDGIAFDTAAKLNPTKGSFVIGIVTKSTIVADYVDVKWTAMRDVDETVTEKSNMRISIKPNSLVIKPRDSKYLEAICSNMTNKTVRWSVSSENGGEIDANGLYVAPNIEGVYEVVVQSAVYPEIKASIMVVVRE